MKKKWFVAFLSIGMVFFSISLLMAQDVIKIGIYADISAGTAQWGTDAVKGAKLIVKEVNAAGGVLGKKIEPVIYDCKVSPTEGVKVYTRLVNEDRVPAVYGSLISNIGLAVSPVAEKLKVPDSLFCGTRHSRKSRYSPPNLNVCLPRTTETRSFSTVVG